MKTKAEPKITFAEVWIVCPKCDTENSCLYGTLESHRTAQIIKPCRRCGFEMTVGARVTVKTD